MVTTTTSSFPQGCPYGHLEPKPDICKWCHMAVVKDQRYFKIWFGEVIEPSLIEKAKNFATALVEHISTGRHVVSKRVYELRLSKCVECAYYDSDRVVCKHSSCGCNLKTKSWWESQKCPLGLWDKEEEDGN